MAERNKEQAIQLPLPDPETSDKNPKYVPPEKATTVFKSDGSAQRPTRDTKEVEIEESRIYW